MLDINLFREEKGGDPEAIRESQRRRFADVSLVDKVVDLDRQWRDARFAFDRLGKQFNAINKQISELRRAKQDTAALQEESKSVKAQLKEAEAREKELADAVRESIVPIGNLVHESVPVSDDEANNVVVKTWGDKRPEDKLYNHVDLVQLLDLVDLEAGSAVAGGRGYYLKREGPLLNQALINFALQFGYARGYSPVHTPFFMRQEVMAECAQLSQFDDELYKVTGEGDDKYLIATSEQTLCALHRKGWFEAGDLPIKYVGYSTCFRKEVGSHGRDTLGIFRVHQFEKVEQFVVCSPHDNASWEAFEEMLANAEQFYQALKIPYQVVNIVSGELNNAAAKKYDLEAWFPASKTYRELVSCSNCTDYQSRRLEIRVRASTKATTAAAAAGGPPTTAASKNEYVHLLNSTLTATSRTLCCLLENYQTPDGLKIPEALQPFMMGITFIPFRKQFDSKGKLEPRPEVPPVSMGSAAAMSTS